MKLSLLGGDDTVFYKYMREIHGMQQTCCTIYMPCIILYMYMYYIVHVHVHGWVVYIHVMYHILYTCFLILGSGHAVLS